MKQFCALYDLENEDMKPLIRFSDSFQFLWAANKALIGSRKIRDPTATILEPLLAYWTAYKLDSNYQVGSTSNIYYMYYQIPSSLVPNQAM